MSLVSNLLAPLDAIRAIGGIFGLRVFTVVVRRRTWTGVKPGVGQHTDVDTALTNQGADGNLYPVRVRQLTRQEVFASGGQYAARDLKVGPITPTFLAEILLPAAGFDDTEMDPMPTGGPQGGATQLIWIVASPQGTHGIPPGGIICEKKGEEATSLHTYVILRSTGRPPT